LLFVTDFDRIIYAYVIFYFYIQPFLTLGSPLIHFAAKPGVNWNFCLLIALFCLAQFLLITDDCSNLIIHLGLFISKLVRRTCFHLLFCFLFLAIDFN